MRHNYKFHAIALTVICAVITIMYVLLAPPPPAPVEPGVLQGNRYIEIYSATWGMGCNPYIEQAKRSRHKLPVETDAEGNPIEPAELTLVRPNNALRIISSTCNGSLTCELTPTSESLGIEPLASCFKTLEVSYRCFAYDRLWNIKIDQGETKTIDCNEDASPPEAN